MKQKMDLENGSVLCCLKRLYLLRKAETATVVRAIDPGRQRVSRAAASDSVPMDKHTSSLPGSIVP